MEINLSQLAYTFKAVTYYQLYGQFSERDEKSRLYKVYSCTNLPELPFDRHLILSSIQPLPSEVSINGNKPNLTAVSKVMGITYDSWAL